MHNDFESLSGWVPEAQLTLNHSVAHSGRYCLRVGAGNEYSMSFKKVLNQVFATQPTKIKVSGWAMLATPEAKATLVVAINESDAPDAKSQFWAGLGLADEVKTPNKWVEVSKTIELPAGVTPKSVLTIYLWANGDQPVYLDDIELTQE